MHHQEHYLNLAFLLAETVWSSLDWSGVIRAASRAATATLEVLVTVPRVAAVDPW